MWQLVHPHFPHFFSPDIAYLPELTSSWEWQDSWFATGLIVTQVIVDISVLRHLTNISGRSWEALGLNFMSSFLSLPKGSCLVRLVFLTAQAVNSLTDQTAGVVPETYLCP